jgi:hypothetical protein
MAVEEPAAAYPENGRTAYGRFIRERGTLKILIAAVLLTAIWYAYSIVRTNQLLAVSWQPLQPDPNGLTVVGVQDKDRPGSPRKYKVIEANKTWRVYRPDDEEGGESQTKTEEPETPEAQDRPTSPGAGRGAERGSLVPPAVLMKECPTVLLGRHFTDARVEEKYEQFFNRAYYIVHVGLTDEGSSRYYQYSKKYDKERLAFLLEDEVIICPRINHMNVSTLDIEQFWVKADAERFANYINNQKR